MRVFLFSLLFLFTLCSCSSSTQSGTSSSASVLFEKIFFTISNYGCILKHENGKLSQVKKKDFLKNINTSIIIFHNDIHFDSILPILLDTANSNKIMHDLIYDCEIS